MISRSGCILLPRSAHCSVQVNLKFCWRHVSGPSASWFFFSCWEVTENLCVALCPYSGKQNTQWFAELWWLEALKKKSQLWDSTCMCIYSPLSPSPSPSLCVSSFIYSLNCCPQWILGEFFWLLSNFLGVKSVFLAVNFGVNCGVNFFFAIVIFFFVFVNFWLVCQFYGILP